VDGTLVDNHKTWLVKVAHERDVKRRRKLLSVGKSGLYILDPTTHETEFYFPYREIVGFETNTAYEALIWRHKPEPKENGEGWNAAAQGLQSVLDLQAEINEKITRLLAKELGNTEEASKVMDDCRMTAVVTTKKSKTGVEKVEDLVSNSLPPTPAKSSTSPRNETPFKVTSSRVTSKDTTSPRHQVGSSTSPRNETPFKVTSSRVTSKDTTTPVAKSPKERDLNKEKETPNAKQLPSKSPTTSPKIPRNAETDSGGSESTSPKTPKRKKKDKLDDELKIVDLEEDNNL